MRINWLPILLDLKTYYEKIEEPFLFMKEVLFSTRGNVISEEIRLNNPDVLNGNTKLRSTNKIISTYKVLEVTEDRQVQNNNH